MTVEIGTSGGTAASVLVVVTVLVASSVVGLIGFSGTADAASTITGTSLDVADPGISTTYAATRTNHNWTVEIAPGVSHKITHVDLNYSGYDTTFHGMTASNVSVSVNGTRVGAISGVSTEDGGQTLNVSFASGSEPTLTGNEVITVNTTGQRISNPSTPGSYTGPSIHLYDATEFGAQTTTLTTYAGTLNGTVRNATDQTQTLSSAAVTVRENGQTVATATSDATGNYSTRLPYGTFTVNVTRSQYNTTTRRGVQVNPGSTATVNANLSPTGTLSGTIQNDTGASLTGTSVTLNKTTGGQVYHLSPGGSNTFGTDVETGTWNVTVEKPGYVNRSWSNVALGANETKSHTFRLTEKGTVRGTVTNESGSTLAGIYVSVWNQSTNTQVGSDRTGPSGAYSVSVPPGTYDVFASDAPPEVYEQAAAYSVQAAKGTTVTTDLTMSEKPPDGTLSGTVTDPDGNPVSGATVTAVDSTYTTFETATTNGQGRYSVAVPAGTYEVTASQSGYADGVESDVNVTANTATSVSLQLARAAYVSGTVTDANGPVQGVWVMADSGDGEPTFEQTDANGDYNLTVPPGDTYRVVVLARGKTASPQTASPSVGSTVTADFSLKRTQILDSSIEVANPTGVDAAKIGLSANVRNGIMMVQARNRSSNAQQGMPTDLQGLGVGPDTEFVINVTVTNYDPTTLLWGAKDVTWTATQNDTNPAATDISVRTQAVDMQGIDSRSLPVGPLMTRRPSDVQWPSGRNDRADLGWNKTVYFGLFDMATAPASVRNNFEGMTVTTNAQAFAPPRMVNDTLRVWVAGPHRTIDGNTHSGFYEATIPDAQLQTWGVDPANAKSELQVSYQGKSQNFRVTDLADGVRIHLDIHYSAGSVEVGPTAAADSGSTAASSGGGGVSKSVVTRRGDAGSGGAGVTYTIDQIAVGDPVTATVEGVRSDGLALDTVSVAFDGGTNIDQQLAVRASETAPSGVAARPDEGVTRYVTVDVSGTMTERVTGGSFTFELAQTAMPADPSAVTVYRFHDGSWRAVETTYEGEGRFTVTTPGYSTFAVVVADASAGTTETTTTTTTIAATTTAATTTTAPTSTTTATTTATTTDGERVTATTTQTGGQAGFTVVLSLVALLGAALLRRH